MDDPSIRPLTADDLNDAFVLSSTAGWNQRIDDWRMLLALAPHGCFGAWSAGRVVGTAIGIDYGGFGWIAMMLVDPAYRRRGLGRRLLEAAMGAVPSDRPIRLDATPLGRPLYQSYGFVDEARLTRLVAPAGAVSPAQPPESGESGNVVQQLSEADRAHVVQHDAAVFGGHRRAVLEWALDAGPALGWIAGRDSQMPQYCMGRAGRLFTQIGPVVAQEDIVARALVRAAWNAAGDQAITIDAFDEYPAFGEWLRSCGFEAQRPLFRMTRPASEGSRAEFPRAPSPLAERAILGPEFA